MKKKVALSATAIAVLASTVPTHIALVQAEETGNLIYVNSTGAGNQNDGGNGSQTNPYKQLSTAVAKAKDGDTIVVVGEGYVNDLWNGGPWVIDKDITIRGEGTVPPSLNLRPAGIVLEGNVKFEFVDIVLYNASSAYMYANGHRLEVINSTFSGNNKPIELYAGHKADSSKQGSNGSIIVKTDSSFKGNNKKATINTIYAGGESGTNSIPTNIQVSQGASSSIALTNIVGQDSSGADINSDMSINLHEVDPVVYGGTGNNTLTMSSVNLRGVNTHRINTVNLTQGSFELTDDSVTEIPQLSIGSGATLDLTKRWDDLTIGTYTGQGGIILPNDSTKVSITNPVGTSESLSIYLQGYNKFTEINGWHECDFTYVTTANEDAPIKLYGDNDFKSGYNFIPVPVDGKYEWQVAKPQPVTPDIPNPPEVEEKDPVLTGITAEQPTQTISLEGLEEGTIPSATFRFNMNTNTPLEEMTWFDQLVTPTIKVDNQEAQQVEYDDIPAYRVGDLVVYFEPDDSEGSNNNSQKMVVLFVDKNGQPTVPVKDTYELEISSGEVGPLELTLNIEGLEEVDPDGPDEVIPDPEPTLPTITGVEFTTDSHTVQRNSEALSVDYNFTATSDTGTVDLTQYPLTFTFDGVQATRVEDTNEYTVADKGITIEVTNGRIQVRGTTEDLEARSYPITMSVGGITKELSLVVQEPPAPPIEPTEPVVTGATFDTVNVEVTGGSTFVANYDFSVTTEDGRALTSPFTKPFTFAVDGNQAVYQEATDTYRIEELGLLLQVIKRTEDNQLQLVVTGDGEKLKAGNHNITFGVDGKEYTQNLSLQVKEATPPPTVPDPDPLPPTDGEEQEPAKHTIQQFTKGSYLYEGPPASELSIPFEVEFDTKPSQPVPFHEIEGTKVVFSGEEFEYREGRYYSDSQIIVLEIRTGDEVGKYTAVLKNVSGTNEIPSGTHSFTLQASDEQAVLNYTVRYIINNLTADVKEKTFKANDFSSNEEPKTYFTFEAETNNEHKELSWYEGFSLTINGEPADALIKDGRVYYRIYKENAYAYIDYEEATNNYKLVLVTEDSEGNPAPPKGNKYTIALSYKEGTEPLTFTANVQGEEEEEQPTTLPYFVATHSDYGDGVTTTFEDSVNGVSFLVLVKNEDTTCPEGELHDLGVSIEFGQWNELGVYDEDKDAYYFNSHNVKATVERVEGDYHKLTFTKLDEDGNPTSFYPSSYSAVIGNNTVGPTRVEFTVTSSAEPPTPDTTEVTYTLPEGQANQEETVTKIAGMLSSHDFFVTPQFVPTTPSVDRFLNGLTVTIGGHKAERVGENYQWIAEGVDVSLGIGPNGDDGYKVSFRPLKPSDGSLLDDGQYTATIQYGDSNPVATFKLNVESEQVTPTPPPVVDPDPEQPPTPEEGEGEDGGDSGKDPDQVPPVQPEPENPTVADISITPNSGTHSQVRNGEAFEVTSRLGVVTSANLEVGVNDFDFYIGDKHATPVDGQNGVYTLDGTGITLTVTPTDTNKFSVVMSGISMNLSEGNYNLYVQVKGHEAKSALYFDVLKPTVDPEPDKPSTENPGTNNGEGSSGSGTPQPKPENPPSGGGTTTQPTNPPSQGGGGGTTITPPTGSGGSSSGGTTLPAPDPKPEKPAEKPPVVDKPTPVPPQQEETKPTTRPTVKPGAIASAVEALEDLATTIREKVDSLLTEVVEQAKGLVLDLTGDADDLSSVSTLEVTKDGIFANVDGEKVKFASDLKLEDIDMSKIRIIRADGSPIPYKTNGESFSINTHNFKDILITERVVEPFVDVSKDDWFQPYVDEAFNRGITTGTTASTFSPNQAITRAQAAVLLARMYELKPTSERPTLKDSSSKWYANEVQALVDNGIIKGYGDGTFRGEEEITREQLAVMLQRLADKQGENTKPNDASKFTDTDKMSAEGKSAIQWAAEQGIINSGKGVAFRPKESTTRAQVAKMLTLFMNK